MSKPDRLGPVLCVDVGSTFTKAVLVDVATGAVLAGGSVPTTSSTDVLDGVARVRDQVGGQCADRTPSTVLVCSSAGGGLRLAVVGYESLVTAEAGRRVALSAGGTVVHVHSGPLDAAGLTGLTRSRPDVVLLVGGTDGGNAEVLVHNASRLGSARVGRQVPVVLAGNAAAADAARAALGTRPVEVAPNVLPRIGDLAPEGARAAIRDLFLRHVIGGKGLSRGRLDGLRFRDLVRAPTPDAVLDGVKVLAELVGEVLVVDVGGATTDVYSTIDPEEGDHPRREVVAALRHARTVEGDLGMRWGAPGIIRAARAEQLLGQGPVGADGSSRADGAAGPGEEVLTAHADRLAAEPALVPTGPGEWALEERLAALAVRVAVRRHARPAAPGQGGRPLRGVRLVVGSGGVLRHGSPALRRAVLEPVLADHAGGWPVPREARLAVDEGSVLFAAGLLARSHPQAARALVEQAFG